MFIYFPTGQLTATQGVCMKKIYDQDFEYFLKSKLNKYITGEWGDLPPDDKAANDSAVRNGGRILARYNYNPDRGSDIYIITEADRSQTTILFCNEY